MQAVGAILFLLWLGLSLAAMGSLIWRIALLGKPVAARVAMGVLLAATWGALQFAAVIGSLMIGYCENCAGKPMQPRDIVIVLMLLAPTALLCALWWFTRRPTPTNWAG